jgi:hypothetical protein
VRVFCISSHVFDIGAMQRQRNAPTLPLLPFPPSCLLTISPSLPSTLPAKPSHHTPSHGLSMTDLPDLSQTTGEPLTESQICGILAQIDLDILNLLRDGKLAALKYSAPGAGPQTDRAANLQALLHARESYQKLLHNLPLWRTSAADLSHT